MKHDHPIRTYRKANSLRLEDFAGKVGISGASLSRIERLEQNPPLDLLVRIREASNGEISLDDLPPPSREAGK